MAKYTFTGDSSNKSTSSTNNTSISDISTQFENIVDRFSVSISKINDQIKTFGKAIDEHSTLITNNVKATINKITTPLKKFGDFIKDNKFTRFIGKSTNSVSKFVKSLNENKFIKKVDEIVDNAGRTLQNGLSMILGDGLFGQIVSNAVTKIVTSSLKIIARLPLAIGKILKTIPLLISKSLILGKILLFGLIAAGVIMIGMWLWNAIKKAWNWIKDLGNRIWDGITNFWKKITNGISDFFKNIWDGFKNSWLGRKLGLSDDEDKPDDEIETNTSTFRGNISLEDLEREKKEAEENWNAGKYGGSSPIYYNNSNSSSNQTIINNNNSSNDAISVINGLFNNKSQPQMSTL